MVIRIVFTAVYSNVDILTHHKPHPVTSIPTNSCGSFAGISRGQLCLVRPMATGALWQVIEFTRYFFA
jgi:hypothetical protein